MVLDAATRRNLELTETIRTGAAEGSLLSALDYTVSPMGKRLIRQWVSKPLLNLEQIHRRQHAVRYLLEEGMLRAELRAGLKPLADLERLSSRVIAGHATPRDLVALRATLRALPAIIRLFPNVEGPLFPALHNLSLCEEELQLLESAIDDEPPATLQTAGVIRCGFSSELDNVVEASRHARDWIANLENVERERTGIKTLKVGYNKVFGYYIEITTSANRPWSTPSALSPRS